VYVVLSLNELEVVVSIVQPAYLSILCPFLFDHHHHRRRVLVILLFPLLFELLSQVSSASSSKWKEDVLLSLGILPCCVQGNKTRLTDKRQ
jgi:hypothetical protein